MRPQRVIEKIAKLTLDTNPELKEVLDYRAEELQRVKCTNPVIGRWVDEFDVKYLLSSFALEDAEFAAHFPAMATITAPQRQKLLETFNTHFEYCQHCSLKRGYDLELGSQIKNTGRQHKETLIQMIEAEEADAEDDHLKTKLAIIPES